MTEHRDGESPDRHLSDLDDLGCFDGGKLGGDKGFAGRGEWFVNDFWETVSTFELQSTCYMFILGSYHESTSETTSLMIRHRYLPQRMCNQNTL